MAKSAETDPFVSERRLVQVASVVNAVARGQNWMVWEAMNWLSQQVSSGALGATLYMPPGTPAEDVHTASTTESLARWESMARQAKRRKVDELQMPSAASSWCVHADDLLAFASNDGMAPATKTALKALAAARLKGADKHGLPLAAENTPATKSRPVQVAVAQDEAILQTLAALGYDGTALPKPTRSGGAKAAAWKVLRLKPDLFTESSFNKAWERLRKEKRIGEAPSPSARR